MYKEDDCHFGAWNIHVEGEVDWTPFHSAKGVWSSQYLLTPPVRMTKPKLTSKPLPASSSISKLVLKETLSDTDDHQRIELTGGGNARRLAGTDVVLINHFVQ